MEPPSKIPVWPLPLRAPRAAYTGSLGAEGWCVEQGPRSHTARVQIPTLRTAAGQVTLVLYHPVLSFLVIVQEGNT